MAYRFPQTLDLPLAPLAFQPRPPAPAPAPTIQDFNNQIVRKTIEVLCRSKKPLSLRDLTQGVGDVVRLSEKQLYEILENYTDNFSFICRGSIENWMVTALTRLGLCREHCSKQGQCRGFPICDGLHICKFYLLSSNCRVQRQGKTCLFGHDLTTQHNLTLLRKYMLEHLSVNDIKSLFRTTESRSRTMLPTICRFYNINEGCRTEKDGLSCPYLHICKFYVIGQCRFGKRCKRNHDIFSPQIKDILQKYGIDIQRSPKEILAEIRNNSIELGDDTSSQTSEGSFRDPMRQRLGSDDEESEADFEVQSTNPEISSTEICIFHLRGRCAFGKSCRKRHCDMMYQWQYRKKGLTDWEDFPKNHNQMIEINFCEVNNQECFLDNGSGVIRINFDQMEGVGVENRKVVLQIEVQRLSTASSGAEKFQPLATTWKWYWEDHKNRWLEYGHENKTGYKTVIDSSSMEQNYLENSIGQMRFATMGHSYVMDFDHMVQLNIETRTQRCVRRRPVFVEKREMDARKHRSPGTLPSAGAVVSAITGPALTMPILSYIPRTWNIRNLQSNDKIYDHFNRSLLYGPNHKNAASELQEIQEIKELFHQSMSQSLYDILCIERVENGELWMNFVSKKEKMKRKSQNGQIGEKALFHGTSGKYVDAICRQGFDFRFSGRTTGTKLGKGSYFAKSAKFADSYTDRAGSYQEMFLVKGLVGEFAKGDSAMRRPPPKNPQDPFQLYDSCVDDVNNPNIFVIFTFDQVYPEYVIRYRRMY